MSRRISRRERRCLLSPVVEALEPRWALAVSALFSDGTLSIFGDEGDNQVAIVATERGLEISGDGAGLGTFAGVHFLHVDLGQGSDGIDFDPEEARGPGAVQDTDGDGIPEIVDGYGVEALRLLTGDRADLLDLHSDVPPDRGGEAPVAIDWSDRESGTTLSRIQLRDLLEVRLEMGDGDDEVLTQGTLYIAKQEALRDRSPYGVRLIGGGGVDVLRIETGQRADQFNIGPAADNQTVEIAVADTATGRTAARVVAVDTEDIVVKGGDGDDAFSVGGPLLSDLRLFGESGDDVGDSFYDWTAVVERELGNVGESHFDGGAGKDLVAISGSRLAERFDVSGLAAPIGPDPRIEITDLATGLLIDQWNIINIEGIAVDTAGGDDQVVVRDDRGLLAGIEWRIATGGGDDIVDGDVSGSGDHSWAVETGAGHDDVALRFGGVTGDATLDISTGAGDDAVGLNLVSGVELSAILDINTGAGDDRVQLELASEFKELVAIVNTGAGNDGLDARLQSPANSVGAGSAGPSSVRLNVIAGAGDDFVRIRNAAVHDFFDLYLDADLSAGDDTWEAAGTLLPRVDPGPGTDRARLTRNLLPFTEGFEIVEVLEGE